MRTVPLYLNPQGNSDCNPANGTQQSWNEDAEPDW